MTKWDLVVPTASEGAMSANVSAHVGHARAHRAVFWDVNGDIRGKEAEALEGSYIYLVEKDTVEWRFTIAKVLPGHEMYTHWLDHDDFGKFFTESRKYKGKDLEDVENGDKCGTLILMTRPESIDPIDVTEFTGKTGNRLIHPLRGSHRLVEPLDSC
ncbi:MAG: hypothetical protein GQ558_07575 [Thermoplasmata archaeon]|nr:hypothetical protein [Thermoplasmata archaeon]